MARGTLAERNVYRVTVERHGWFTHDVVVTVTNVDEDGVASLDPVPAAGWQGHGGERIGPGQR